MFIVHLGAEEKGPVETKEKPEYAWSDYGEQLAGGPFVYGSIPVPRDLIRKCLPDDNEEDPFSASPPAKPQDYRTKLKKFAPVIPRKNVPPCIPSMSHYRDVSLLMLEIGVAIKNKQWAIFCEDYRGDTFIYFCTTLMNADIIEQICVHRRGGPRSVMQLVTLVSIENQKLNNTAWTVEKLTKLSPKIHARYGNLCRSGEKSSAILTYSEKSKFDCEIEPVVGENSRLLDCRLALSASLPGPIVDIRQETAVTALASSTAESEAKIGAIISSSSIQPSSHVNHVV